MINRRTFLTSSTAAGGALVVGNLIGSAAEGAEFSFKWGNTLPSTHPLNVHLTNALANIRRETNGRVDIQLFADGQLGGDADMSAQLRSGALEFYSAGFLAFASIVPVAGLANIPFAFQDYGQVWAAVDGELGKFIASQISQRGLHVFETVYDNGFRQVTSATRPITTAEDMKGFKIRTPSSPVNIGLFKALGAAVSVMSVNEVYLALQTRIVDGQENPLISVSTLKLNEVQKYAALTNHLWDGFPQLVNGNVWKSIPADLQQVISKNINASGLSQREDAKRLNESLRAELERKGMVFNTTDQQAFKSILIKSGFYEEWRKKLGEPGWGILQKYSGALG